MTLGTADGWKLDGHDFSTSKTDLFSCPPDAIILGINAYFHDSSAAFVRNAKILWASQEERFDRVKNSSAFPKSSILRGLDYLGLTPESISQITYFENPDIKLDRISRQIKSASLISGSRIVWSNSRRLWRYHLFLRKTLRRDLRALGFSNGQIKNIRFSEHHLSHAASAFLPSPYKESCIVIADAVGEDQTTTIWKATRTKITLLASLHFPNSLGMFYSAFTYFCGFKVNSGEYKLMGLAPYGEPKFVNLIFSNILFKQPDGSFTINHRFLTYEKSSKIVSQRALEGLFGFPARTPESSITKNYMDLAASVQVVLNEMMLSIVRFARDLSDCRTLCLAGGVSLNCVSNGVISSSRIFDDVWIQPASGDAGTSLGAALLLSDWQSEKNLPVSNQSNTSMLGAFLGSEYDCEQIRESLDFYKLTYEEVSREQMIEECCSAITENRVVGFFQGRMEFGPRSLGARSILANPKDPDGQKRINLKIKFRESFRPFAPAIRNDQVQNYFEEPFGDSFMLRTTLILARFRNTFSRRFELSEVNDLRSQFPSITHVDFSSRVQTVDGFSPLYPLLRRLEDFDIPMVVNTSFNVRGEPIVESPADAINCFLSTDLDDLFIGNFHVKKELQHIDSLKVTSKVNLD